MEFKDNLKQLRTQKGLTQAQLAELIFVSRSTVAKWENGLGLPTPESMSALATLFEIPEQELLTNEPETVIVEKNRKLHLFWEITGWAAMLALTVLMVILPFAIHRGVYGFTPDMAAGAYAGQEYIDTGDYRFYYFTFEGDWEDGRHWTDLQGWKPIRKHFWGCTVVYDDMQMQVITKNNYVVGRLYSVKGKNGYYNLILKSHLYKVDESGQGAVWDIPEEFLCAESISTFDQEYELQNGFFFITEEPVTCFLIGDVWYDIEE